MSAGQGLEFSKILSLMKIACEIHAQVSHLLHAHAGCHSLGLRRGEESGFRRIKSFRIIQMPIAVNTPELYITPGGPMHRKLRAEDSLGSRT